ncbi:hypothetical protein SISNIDRAFT_551075 [Sistotremastrum niveocremeum HHB9708]|uniref:RRM domain-containing protein n=1 Tax=Sistotremastrum niveocremeum HHB9708 TaxID=1314777 RepID=A0A164S904_9AGAM|nr:hypothetical protein SISNIDRAFT_551075 [Sistotremastrum niveocremeum HHB9708]
MSSSGFTTLPVSYGGSIVHYLYVTEHRDSKGRSQYPSNRTLFVVNVPPDATDRELRLFFNPHGNIEKVAFNSDHPQDDNQPDESSESESDEEGAGDAEDATILNGEDGDAQPNQAGNSGKRRSKPRGKKEKPPIVTPLPSAPLRRLRPTGKSAYVVYLDDSAVKRALSSINPESPRVWPSSSEPRGLAHYTALHDSRRPSLDAVRLHADSSIELFDYEVAKRKQKSQYHKGEAIVDEDGFTLVTRGGAYGKTLGGGVGVASKKFQSSGATDSKKKKKPKEKEMFYAFQHNEKRRAGLIKLKKDWEADQAKVTKLREQRRFKPY